MSETTFTVGIQFDSDTVENPAANICQLLLFVVDRINKEGISELDIELSEDDGEVTGWLKVSHDILVE